MGPTSFPVKNLTHSSAIASSDVIDCLRLKFRMGFIVALLLTALTVFPCLAASDYPFIVRGDRDGVATTLIASNRGPATVSAKITVWGSNLGSDKTFPLIARVPAYSDIPLAHLFPAQQGSATFSWNTEFLVGDIDGLHDPAALYRMPYSDGDMLTISQAPIGRITTHTKVDSRNAIDIPMPEGMPILAARDGIVVRTEAGNTAGIKSPDLLSKANFVEVQHLDGSIALYAHLMPNGVLVSPGQRVLAGTRIGLAGSTGYSSGPHLHFAVQETRTGDSEGTGRAFHRASVPFRFYVGLPPMAFEPKEGLQVVANYSGPAMPPTITPPSPTVVAALPAPIGHVRPSADANSVMYLSIPQPVAAFLRTLPGWVWYVAAVAGVLLILVLVRPRQSNDDVRIEPWDRDGR